jgi:HAD superfamily hydrolase (TIGR01509 family)
VTTGRLVIFDAFNTLVTARRGSSRTFLAGLAHAGLDATESVLAEFQLASEGFDHSAWSASRQTYVTWAEETLRRLGQEGASPDADLAPCVVPALEQLHQAPMVAMPGAAACLRELKAAGFAIAVCSNWGWDLEADLESTGLTANVDVLVTSAQTGCRKPHPRIYQAALELAGFRAEDAVFVGDSLRTDVLGPQRVGIRSMLLASEPADAFGGEQAGTLAAVARLLTDGTPDQELRSGGVSRARVDEVAGLRLGEHPRDADRGPV